MEEEKKNLVVKDATKKTQWEKELETINNSIKGRVKIDAAATLTDIGTNNSKEILFTAAKEFYVLTKKILSSLEEEATEASPEAVVHLTAADVDKLIETKLTNVLPPLLTETIPGLLKDVLKCHSTNTGDLPEVSAQAPVKEEPVRSHSILLGELQEEGQDEDREEMTHGKWTTVVKGDVAKSLESVPVVKARYLKDGSARLDFETKEDMAKAENALKDKYSITSRTREQKKLDPKLTISDLDAEISTKEILEEKLLLKNDFLNHQKDTNGEKLTVLFLGKDYRGNLEGVIQVSAGMREAIRRNDDRLCVGLQRHTVRDRIHVIQCFHCQGYGHKTGSPYCKLKDVKDGICFFCAGSHSTRECRRKKNKETDKIKCVNCFKSKRRHEKEKCCTHRANDTLCPFYVREKERIMGRTHGCEAAKNVYLRRTEEHQRKQGRL